jgi:hypothetical protein
VRNLWLSLQSIFPLSESERPDLLGKWKLQHRQLPSSLWNASVAVDVRVAAGTPEYNTAQVRE